MTNYADIDFEEINELTNLATDEIKCLKVCFDLFDTAKQEFLSGDDLGEIMRAMGFRPTEENLQIFYMKLMKMDRGSKLSFGSNFVLTFVRPKPFPFRFVRVLTPNRKFRENVKVRKKVNGKR
eukprot:TRINITY_DN1042_c0_g1_i1.p1 TRINITY_DN1042_c0_g1~~TRINITY_DN1042_c0_g1_i1.p1  ORF type:complete len:123 (-),score=2.99 TRINITY_DN1042_c0_g1_i1:246-614(-)